ncbi:MAG: aminotransferase class III-fold pyridoxal phosphate-dependent enzyme [Candidatus Rokuibacteriota bacterium]|nr:MAG: aminotransferase class III-fold pyridoxal phosphate-dependent enzyme [Candidatus Rokubacteria bacterium]
MIAAIVQARLGSTRLPGKTLMDVAGRPLLGHLVERTRRIPGLDAVVLATTGRPADRALADFAGAYGLPVYAGSEEDVLDRFYQAARRFGVSVVVRVTPDCPLLDPAVAGLVLRRFLDAAGELDYASNTQPPTFPDGQDTEVFSAAALARAWREARLPSEREHVTPYIWKHPDRFRLANVRHAEDLSRMRWTVDEAADLEFVRRVFARLGADRPFGMGEVLDLLRREPALLDINRSLTRNDGYARSVRADGALSGHPGESGMETPRPLARSEEYFARAEKVIPSCTQTFSKGHTQLVRGVAPLFLQRADGSHVWDVDGNEYIDYPLALGPIVLGHNDPDVTAAVRAQLADGVAFSLPHPLEVEVSELLTEVIPCAAMVRFGKNGPDATAGAVRVARAYTGRERIAACGYHGWQDWYIGATTRHRGVPAAVRELTQLFAYNDLASLRKIFDDHPGQIAAVIMEPVGVVEPVGSFLQDVAALARANGAVLIYDEVVTSFRVALGGAQAHYRVTPDLACIGKAMANGYPVSAVVGRRDLMQVFDEIFFSFTFGGEALSLAAARATITKIRDTDVIPHLWRQGRRLQDGYNALAAEAGVAEITRCIGLPPRTVLTFADRRGVESLALKSLFQQEVVRRGILNTGGFNLCARHSDGDVARTLEACRAALAVLAAAVAADDVEARLQGPAIQPVFRRA